MQDTDEITAAREAATTAGRAAEVAATYFARQVARVAALIVRTQFPTATMVIFEKDETIGGETTIEIVRIEDAFGKLLGELDSERDADVTGQIKVAYDANVSYFGVCDQAAYGRAGSDYEDKNLLELYVGGAVKDDNRLLPTLTPLALLAELAEHMRYATAEALDDPIMVQLPGRLAALTGIEYDDDDEQIILIPVLT
jgi:hypothetical protein